MVDRIAGNIAILFLKKNIISEDDVPVYKYGMQVLIGNIMGMMLIVGISIMLSRLVEGIIFVFLYATLRIYTGGYHAKTSLRCNTFFVLTYLLVLELNELAINSSLAWILFLLSYMIIVRYSPVENVNKDLEDYERIKYKRKSVIISTVIVIMLMAGDIIDKYHSKASVILMADNYNGMSLYIKLVIISIAVLMIIGMNINNRRKENMKA